MRNLKKILALVLALVMSLSLMATAGAADFSDKDQITDKYSDAVTVLNGLEVFKGYDNGATFQPQGDITRAEVAAIIYRIATGDVTDAQKDIYSSWGLFTDVVDGSWYAGYVNYCANAGYIKGRGNKIFDPNGKVTGYEALAMILRAVGYDKNNEFSGSNWQVNTASIAKQRGITNNITDTLLGGPATREVVAEILFQAILVPTVTFNTATLSYTTNATSLGKDILNLDKVTGVVVANEYANVQDDDLKVLAEGKTQLRVAAGDVRTLDYTTDLTDIGMSQNAYIQGSKVLLIAEGANTVFDNTDKNGGNVDISTASKFSSVSGVSKNDDTEFFVNFDHSTEHKANRRIELRVTFNGSSAETAFDSYTGADISKVAYDNSYTVYVNNSATVLNRTGIDDYKDHTGYGYPVEYVKVFRVDDVLTDNDLKVIKGIFGMADDNDATTYGVSGSVYVGTNSQDIVGWSNYAGDKSNDMSYTAFKAEYIDESVIKNWSTSNDGEWVKIIDNDSDGYADYAFKTTFTLDKAVSTYTSGDKSTLRYYALDIINGPSAKYMNTVAEGDIVLHTTIDEQALIWKANSVEAEIAKINDIFKRTVTATTASGDTYNQSEISNATRLDQLINQMSETVNYRMYLDAFGRVRAYEPVDGTKYALITELYYGNYRNNRYVVDDVLTAEMKAGDAAITERVVNNPLNNDFVLSFTNTIAGRDTWTKLNTVMNQMQTVGTAVDYERDLYIDIVESYNYYNGINNIANWSDNVVLQPAVAHLGFSGRSYAPENIFRNATTNVARYVVNSDGTVNLSTAAQLNYNDNGQLNSKYTYGVDYVQLSGSSVRAKQNVFNGVNVGDGFNPNVDAVNETEFYIVANGNVEHFVGYQNLPAVSDVRSMYAVARNTTKDLNNKNYWVAEVIVIESDTYTAQPDDYLFILGRADVVGAATQSNSRMATSSQSLLAISAVEEAVVRVTPADLSWGVGTVTPGFYKAYGVTKQDDGSLSVSKLSTRIVAANVNNANDPVSVNTSAFKLRAGVVTKTSALNDRIEVRLGGSNNVEQLTVRGPALAVIQNAAGYITTSTRLNGDNYSNLVIENREVLWVEDNSSNARFLIDVTWSIKQSATNSTLASLLRNTYNDVSTSQLNPITAGDHTVTINYVDTDGNHKLASGTRAVKTGNELILNVNTTTNNILPTGYQFKETSTDKLEVKNTKNGWAALNNGCYTIENDVTSSASGGSPSGVLTIRNITDNLTVNIPVKAIDHDVSLAAAWNDGTVTAFAECAPSNVETLNVTTPTKLTAHYGDIVTVRLTADNVDRYNSYGLVVKDKNGDKVQVTGTSATGVYTFVMPNENVTLEPTYKAGDVKVTFTNTSGVTLTKTNDETATYGTEYTFDAAAKPGYELTGITYRGNGLSGNVTNKGNGTYAVRADAVATGLTIDFQTKIKEFDVSVKLGAGAPTISGISSYTKQTVESRISFTLDAEPEYFKVDVTGVGGNYTITRTADLKTMVTVYNMTKGGEILIERASK